MKEKIVLALALICLLSFVQGETIKESSFSSMGYEEELLIEEANKKKCKEIAFFDEFNQEEFTIVSIHSEFVPNLKGDANIAIELNNKIVSLIKAGKAKEFERIIIQKKELKEKNYLRICGNTSNTTTKISVFNDSKIGNYKTAFFPENSFEKKVVSKELIVGKEIQIKTSVKNYGNETTLIRIIDGDANRKDIELIKGTSSFEGEIKAGEEIALEFTYKLKDEKTRVLPSAKLYYLNEFGEEQEIESNYPEIKPKQGKVLEPIIMLKKQINRKGEKSEIEVVIINNSLETVRNVELELFSSGLTLENTRTEFESIQPKEIVYFKTSVQSNKAGEFDLDCKLNFGQEQIKCQKTTILFEEETIDQKLIIGIILIIIGVIIYAYIYLR